MKDLDRGMGDNHDPDKPATGLLRVRRAFFFSVDGLRAAWTGEAAFRQEVALAIIALPIAALLPATATQKALLVACIMLVLIVELLNSAVEACVDHISLELHPLAKRAKDVGSAAVLLTLVNLAVVWCLVLYELFG
ncbi:MAG: diacylglycerol kinase (ATP) [Gammaproteobacteria bacterium]|jgi:diacylglycerol kinase (ATP)